MSFCVYELRYKVFLLRAIPQAEALIRIASGIDHILLEDDTWKDMHIKNCQKGYTFSSFYPIAKSGVYSRNEVYQIIIRTVNPRLAEYFSDRLPVYEDVYWKGLICDIKIVHRHHISKLYSLTPVIVKGESGYWRDSMSFDDFQEQMKVNLIKKYKALTGEDMQEDFLLHSYIELKNRVPIKVPYKRIYLLGDKIQMQVSEHPSAQKLAYLALGSGIGTMNQRGMGFVNAKFD